MINQRKVGVVLSYSSMLINILIGLVTVPLMNAFMGKSEYGLYELMGSLIAYMSVMDFGLSATITRYYSRSMALNDEKGKENILAISSIIYAFIAILTVFVGLGLYNCVDIVYTSSLTPYELSAAKKIFIIMIINMTVTIPSHIFTAVLTSNERFIFLRGITMISQAIQPLMYLIVLMKYPTAFAVVLVQTVINFAVIAVNGFYCVKKVKMRVKLHFFNKALVVEMLGFSFFIFLNAVIDQLYWKTDVLILGAVIGTAATGIYGIASRINTMYTNFSASVNSVFLPQITTICTKSDDMSEINVIFKKIGRIQFLIMSLILSGFICFGKEFIMVWAGDKYSVAQRVSAYYICLIVMIPLIVPLIQNIGITILQAKNKHAFRSVVYFAIALMNVALSIPLAKLYGGLGCAIATAIAMVLGNIIIINIYYKKSIGLDVFGFFKEILKLLPVMIVMIILGFLLNRFISGGYIAIGLKAVVFCAIYGMLSWIFSMNSYEKQLVSAPISKILGRIRKR